MSVLLLISGCASVMPYSGSFSCPQTEGGVCASVPDVHRAAVLATGGAGGQSRSSSSSSRVDGVEASTSADAAFNAALTAYKDCLRSARDCVAKEKEVRVRAKELKEGTRSRVKEEKNLGVPGSSDKDGQPSRTPDTLMEVHILPYETETGELVSERRMWIVVEPGGWSGVTNPAKTSAPDLGQVQGLGSRQ